MVAIHAGAREEALPRKSNVRFGSEADVCAAAKKDRLFDHLVGTGKQRWRHGEAEYPGCPGVDDQIEFG